MAGNSPKPRGGRQRGKQPGERRGDEGRAAGPAPVRSAPSAPAPARARHPRTVAVELPITLGQFVKLAGLAATGGDAKQMVTGGMVYVNDEVDTRRGHKLAFGDVIRAGDDAAVVTARSEGARPGRRPGDLPPE